jgi:hypothetical protein
MVEMVVVVMIVVVVVFVVFVVVVSIPDSRFTRPASRFLDRKPENSPSPGIVLNPNGPSE